MRYKNCSNDAGLTGKTVGYWKTILYGYNSEFV